MKGDTYWMWQEATSEGWGVISAFVPRIGGGPVPLSFRTKALALEMEPLARAHVEQTGNMLRLARFHIVDTLMSDTWKTVSG